jgi:hypothetical protein
MEILFLLVGLAFVGLGGLVVVSEARTRRGTVPTPGELVGYSTGKSPASGSPAYYAVASYAGPDGRTRYVESSVGSSAPLGSVGDAITVLIRQDDAERAAIQSPLSYVIGVAIAAMGAVCCIVFFAVFRATTFSVGGALAVVGWGAWKLRGSLRDKPLSFESWRQAKDVALRPRVFTQDRKDEIPWAAPEAVQAAIARQHKTNRFAVPILLLGGAGLLVLGGHLYRRTDAFLARAIRTPGVVVGLATHHSSDGDTYAPVVEFAHAGRIHKFKDSVSSRPASYRVGETVNVLYDPGDPRDARIDRGRWNQAVPILLGASGALLCVLGTWALRRRSAS